MSTATIATSTKLSKQAILMIGMLSAQLLLGMAENLMGKPSETQGGVKVVSGIILTLHALIGLGLIVRGFIALRTASAQGSRAVQLSRLGLTGVLIAFIAGALNMAVSAGDSWYSYAMTLGFLGASLSYGALLTLRQAR